MLVPGALHWWAGVGNDRLIGDCISGCRKAIHIGQKLAEKDPLRTKKRKRTKEERTHPTTARFQKITCVY